jgi:hypothetical protein
MNPTFTTLPTAPQPYTKISKNWIPSKSVKTFRRWYYVRDRETRNIWNTWKHANLPIRVHMTSYRTAKFVLISFLPPVPWTLGQRKQRLLSRARTQLLPVTVKLIYVGRIFSDHVLRHFLRFLFSLSEDGDRASLRNTVYIISNIDKSVWTW